MSARAVWLGLQESLLVVWSFGVCFLSGAIVNIDVGKYGSCIDQVLEVPQCPERR